MSSNHFYITTPIYYVNDSPHIGHAYTTLACDVLARFMRLDGKHVKFLTGTDEHGQKVEKSARAAGLAPQEFTDKVSANFRELAQAMNFSFDDFIRTTEPRHIAACQALWHVLRERDQIYLGQYAGWYAVRDEAYYNEDELRDGPNGTKLAPTGAEVEWVEEPSYFFRLSAWQDRLLQYYADNPEAVAPESRRNEVISFIRSGLKDLSVSRTSFSWGVPVPGDPQHVIYVWLDALTNYITAAGYPDTNSNEYRQFWPANLHMVGKDILRFHTVYWPAFLMAAGLEPAKRVFAHGWWTNEGQKISKSLGNVIDPHHLIAKYGLDPVRYFLLREMPFGSDGDFSHRAIIARINGDLANDLGNLAQRVLTQIARNCNGRIPNPDSFSPADRALLVQAAELLPQVRAELEQQGFHKALGIIWAAVGAGNRYIDEQAPWTLRKTDIARMQTVLYVLAELLRHLGALIQPFMPDAARRLLAQLGEEAQDMPFTALATPIGAEIPIPVPTPIFPRYVDDSQA